MIVFHTDVFNPPKIDFYTPNFISEGLHRLDKTASCDMDFIFSTPKNMQE